MDVDNPAGNLGESVIRGLRLTTTMAVLLAGCAAETAAPQPPVTPAPQMPPAREDGAIGDFQGVLVQRTTRFATGNTNDAIPDFDLQRYDTDGAWSPQQPDRLVIPEEWEGRPVIFTVRAAWAGHTDRWVELKLYCGAERPIGNDQDDYIVAVVQVATNPDSPFIEMNTPPLVVEPGTACMIAFKTPEEQTLIPYGPATTLFGAYVP